MKRILILITIILTAISTPCSEVLSPAVQFMGDEYKDYFKKSTDYKIQIRSRSNYIIKCESDILGVMWGDVENVKMFDVKDEFENNDMKKLIMKTKYETYTYARLYKSSKEIVNIILEVNPAFRDDMNFSLGLCEISPYKE